MPAPAVALLHDIRAIQPDARLEAVLDTLGEINLVGSRQERLLRHLPKIKSDGVVGRYGADIGYRAVLQEFAVFYLLLDCFGGAVACAPFALSPQLYAEFFQFKK